jgi:predicted porin
MKKLLIAAAAMAVVAGTAQAQSSVTVYGRFDQSYNKVDTKKTATQTSTATTTGRDRGNPALEEGPDCTGQRRS